MPGPRANIIIKGLFFVVVFLTPVGWVLMTAVIVRDKREREKHHVARREKKSDYERFP
ncbi:hypothetical protein M408DRAFT_334081 [Serendipita vermifera MAFF 305830]|uniref:Uncharacterized protein n=1 Tax=Serendipita vermifera MAFF 305830 TaxID=933852 RepID=A0A0C2W116_SERVB|nr:hypothetical protein M408DRAFT_334081 [Serendipita vermifera MAFF 305830]